MNLDGGVATAVEDLPSPNFGDSSHSEVDLETKIRGDEFEGFSERL